MDEAADRPKWLLELENRKRKPRLAHEAGAGSPCMVCNNACPGLDLHFWRKICKNCKCSRDDHDVQDDDFPQFHLLFGPSNKYKKKSMFLRVNEKQVEAETVFEWVPPDTTKELASDYMKALPVDKLPIKGTTGAALRRQLLQKQLPLHDIDYKTCDELSDDEKKQFEKYLENIKKYVGQGKVTKILSARPFDRALLTPANATEMQQYSPEHRKAPNSNIAQLRTPSSFTKLAYGKNLANSYNNPDYQSSAEAECLKNDSGKAPTLELYTTINNPKDTAIATSEPIGNDVVRTASPFLRDRIAQHHDANANCSSLTEPGRKEDNTPSLNEMRQGYENSLRDPISSFADSVMADALRPPSTVRANEIIGSTLDPKGLMYIREKLTTKYSAQDTNINNTTPSKSQGLVNDRCKDAAGSNTIPYAPSNLPIKADSNLNKLIGETRECPGNIEKTLLASNTQVTKSVPLESHLLNSGKCYPHSENEPFNDTLGSSRGLINPSNVPQIPGNIIPSQEHCPKSNDTLSGRLCNESATHAPHLCKAEKQAQGKLSSSSIPTNLLHSEELYNQVFPHEPINIMKEQNVPNVEHLRGAIEEMTLESSGPQKCNKCAEEIRIGDVVVVTDKAKNAGWHPGCFVCDVCNELLADLVYFHYKNKLYCGRDLATLLGIPRCFACDELIFVREYTVAEGHNYHVKHFCCWDCDVPLAGQQYITENDRPLCLPCYQTTYAKTCNACNGVIAANQQGVSVKDLDFHASESCFCCYECKKNLLNCRMAIKEGRLFCSKECISSFLVSRE